MRGMAVCYLAQGMVMLKWRIAQSRPSTVRVPHTSGVLVPEIKKPFGRVRFEHIVRKASSSSLSDKDKAVHCDIAPSGIAANYLTSVRIFRPTCVRRLWYRFAHPYHTRLEPVLSPSTAMQTAARSANTVEGRMGVEASSSHVLYGSGS